MDAFRANEIIKKYVGPDEEAEMFLVRAPLDDVLRVRSYLWSSGFMITLATVMSVIMASPI